MDKSEHLPKVGPEVQYAIIGEFQDDPDFISNTYNRLGKEQPNLTTLIYDFILAADQEQAVSQDMLATYVFTYRMLESQAASNGLDEVFEPESSVLGESPKTLPTVGPDIKHAIVGELVENPNLPAEIYRRLCQEQLALTERISEFILEAASTKEGEKLMHVIYVFTYRMLEAQAQANAFGKEFNPDMF